ncbi:MAG: hypothetical protein HFH85_15430 [Lachnospiraceae bacterium]|nr:hypothetical protein [Lachnospiraceae bacterium]
MKNANAYFTVEAALVFPLVISGILFVVYMLLFQYDRCLMEQDLGAMALWGSVAESADSAVFEQKIQKRMAELYRDKYVAWRFTKLDAELDRNHFRTKGRGGISFPLSGWAFPGTGSFWDAEIDFDYSRLAPVTFIRLCHKFDKVKGE